MVATNLWLVPARPITVTSSRGQRLTLAESMETPDVVVLPGGERRNRAEILRAGWVGSWRVSRR